MLNKGIQHVRVVLRALALLQLDEGLSAPKVSRTVRWTAQAIRTIAKRCMEAAWTGPCTRDPGRGIQNCCAHQTSSGLSPWFVASRRKGGRAGRFA
jgi:hypothetical protein